MPPFRSLARISARLLAAGPPQAGPPGPRHRFRLLVIGPAVLVREEPGPWRVTAGGGNALRPVVEGLGAGAVGRQSAVRVAAALLDGKYAGRGASIFLRSFTAKTPLMLAARDGNEGVARLLLARGANPASQDADGRTAHDLADPGPVRRLLAEAETALRHRL